MFYVSTVRDVSSLTVSLGSAVRVRASAWFVRAPSRSVVLSLTGPLVLVSVIVVVERLEVRDRSSGSTAHHPEHRTVPRVHGPGELKVGVVSLSTACSRRLPFYPEPRSFGTNYPILPSKTDVPPRVRGRRTLLCCSLPSHESEPGVPGTQGPPSTTLSCLRRAKLRRFSVDYEPMFDFGRRRGDGRRWVEFGGEGRVKLVPSRLLHPPNVRGP